MQAGEREKKRERKEEREKGGRQGGKKRKAIARKRGRS